MALIETMPNLRRDVALLQSHTVSLVGLCPISGNPQAGSTITVAYTPAASFLEVYALVAYIENYIGGWMRDGAHIRDMEQTIQTIASDCTAALGVPVIVKADLKLDSQQLGLEARSK